MKTEPSTEISLAHFLALLDPDPERREHFVRRMTPLPAPVAGLIPGGGSSPPFAVAWAAARGAPVSVDDRTGVALVLGTAIHGEAGARLTASELRELWLGGDEAVPAPFDGYHAALAFAPRSGLIVGGDVLGRFPIYYAASGDVLLVGTSPELFRHHPSVRREFDPHGLAGILLSNGLVEGRTLWSGVRRLAPGHLLIARPGSPARERMQYRLPFGERRFDEPLARHVERIDAALERAVRRHVPRAPRPLLLLSGGLDSRTVAGYLDRLKIAPIAITHGLPGDIETRCAVGVARALGFEHRIDEEDPTDDLSGVRTRIRWEHLAAGFSGTGGWGGHRRLAPLGETVVSGYAMDWIIGGYAPSSPDLSFPMFFEHQNRWALAPALLDRLLRPERFGDAVRETIAAMEARYRAYSPHDFQRALGFALEHRQRFHIGAHMWAESFGAWPITPASDLAVIESAAGMPAATLDERRLQIELVRTRFPALARLPLDRNSYDMDPLVPGLVARARRRVARRIRRIARALSLDRPPRVERRRYYRRYDINGPGWSAVRAAAETLRPLAADWFRPEVFDEIVPPAGARLDFRDGIVDPAGMRALLGFLFWLDLEANPPRGSD